MDTYEPVGSLLGNRFTPGIVIVVPAYNEAPVIVETIHSLLALEYLNKEIIIVNDGSTDGTRDRVIAAFDMEPIDAPYPVDLPCEPVRNIYRAPDTNLVLLDKENGGKADALNAGLFFTECKENAPGLNPTTRDTSH